MPMFACCFQSSSSSGLLPRQKEVENVRHLSNIQMISAALAPLSSDTLAALTPLSPNKTQMIKESN